MNKKRILLADNNKDEVKEMGMFLKSQGYELFSVSDA